VRVSEAAGNKGSIMEKFLVINQKFGFFGGVEKFIYTTSNLLKNENYKFYGLFEEQTDNIKDFGDIFEKYTIFDKRDYIKQLSEYKEMGITTVLLHKIQNTELLREVMKTFKVITFVHDHDYYCVRHHKYFPVKRINCKLAYNPIYCTFCAGLAVNTVHHDKIFKLVKKSDKLIILSDYMKKNLIKNKFKAEQIFKLHPFSSINCEQYTPTNNKKNRLLFVGQIIRGKGLDLLVKSLRLIKNECELTIIGYGNDVDYIKKLIKKNKLDDKVNFLTGWISNIKEHYEKTDIIVFPSRWQEPFGLVGIEGFSFAKPLIGFNNGGVSEWLKDNYNGLLVKPNSIKDLAGKIDYLIDNPSKMKELGENGLSTIKDEYSVEKFIQDFKNIVEN